MHIKSKEEVLRLLSSDWIGDMSGIEVGFKFIYKIKMERNDKF